jgi:hypothetical protein
MPIHMKKELPDWFKIKGYPHFSSSSPTNRSAQNKLIRKVEDPKYIATYAFYPLLHVILQERKYKKVPEFPKNRSHTHRLSDGSFQRTVKKRLIYYSNHRDALIFGYYAYKLSMSYDDLLRRHKGLSDCITAYRKIPIEGSDKNKGTIHFACEAFSAIQSYNREKGDCCVLTFDIKNFFPSLNHDHLEKKWKEVLGTDSLSADHRNVFNAATRYSFIYKDDLRKFKRSKGRRSGFNEQSLAEIRNTFGISAFFNSAKSFREAVKSGKLRIYPNPGKNEKGEIVGIPQGLPISAVLANIYLLDFDRNILLDLVEKRGCYYRRYSDDIVIICNTEDLNYVRQYVYSEMEKSAVEISKDKTEEFVFKQENDRLQVYKLNGLQLQKDKPFIYLGFEYYGYKTLIKSANLSKFYRRMIDAVKRKSKRAIKIAEADDSKPVLYKRQLQKLYRNIDLDKAKRVRTYKRYELLDTGEFRLRTETKKEPFKSNYFSYVRRAAEIMNEPQILNQIKGEQRVFNQAIERHFSKKIENSTGTVN